MRAGFLIALLATALRAAMAAPEDGEMSLVPAGVFIMGDGVAWCGVDERVVTLTHAFHLNRTEVTNGAYLEAVQWAYEQGHVGADASSVWDNLDGCVEELLDLDDADCEIQFDSAGVFYLREAAHALLHAYPGGYDPANHPVKEVTWFGAARYCDWLSLQAGFSRAYGHHGDWSCNNGDPYGAQGYRLPTDAEWEYAAQHDDDRIYPWGSEDPDCCQANHAPYSAPCVDWTSPVGSYPWAPAALGLSDMAGNVWEWCNDWHVCDLGTAPAIDPTGPNDGSYRVVHGASWNYHTVFLRNATRDPYPGISNDRTGFRVARTAHPSGIDIKMPPGHARFRGGGNQPNPFTEVTHIRYCLPAMAAVSLAIYDPGGRLVRTLVAGQQVGEHSLPWDGTDDAGDPVRSGVYFYRLTAGGQSISRRLHLVR